MGRRLLCTGSFADCLLRDKRHRVVQLYSRLERSAPLHLLALMLGCVVLSRVW